MSTHLDDVREFVGQHVNGASLSDDTDIFATGHVNSLFAIQLVMWIEQTYDISVQGSDLDISHFGTIGAIADFVDAKHADARQV